MATLIAIIIGLALGSLLGTLIVQFVFNKGKRPTTKIENEIEIEKEIKEATTDNSVELNLINNT